VPGAQIPRNRRKQPFERPARCNSICFPEVMESKITSQIIRAALAARGWTLRDLARRLEVDDSWLYRRMSGEHEWARRDLFSVASVFGVRPEALEDGAIVEALGANGGEP
jgi:lambda repressor-like predicted transcriptional regulator